MFVTKISRTEEEITLQAITDLRLGKLENTTNLEIPIEPTYVKRAKSRFSRNREKVIEADISISEVLDRETSAIDFTGINVQLFSKENGL